MLLSSMNYKVNLMYRNLLPCNLVRTSEKGQSRYRLVSLVAAQEVRQTFHDVGVGQRYSQKTEAP